MRIVVKGGVWKNTEDEILKAAVMKYGKNQWSRISSLLVRKSAKQCKARWYEWIDPSIKKTEWTREEDEKLLHLAKIMPTQWRTIAPIVGRTAAQVIDRYEKLLDEAMRADGTNVDGTEDPRRLRPGEVDPNPESKPARPDPVDMDEDEKEMLSEARARLANTKGKKAKRKMREKQLDEAKRLASIQKRRELRAAGIISGKGKRKVKGIDYNEEIPFKRTVPAGFYEVSSKQAPKETQLQLVGMTQGELDGERRGDKEERLRKEDLKKEKKRKENDLPSHVEAMRKLTEVESVQKRPRLALPAPQVHDRELEALAKMSGAAETDEYDVGAGGSATRALLGSYAAGAGGAAATPQRTARTPMQTDTILEDARRLAALTKQETPLRGNVADVAVAELGDFSGITPQSRQIATPNVVATPLRTPGSVAGSVSSVGSSFSSAGGRTPTRDQLGINEDLGGEGAAAIMRQQQMAIKMQLRQHLKALPQAQNEYKTLAPELPTDDAMDLMRLSVAAGTSATVDDMELVAKRDRLAVEAEAEAARKRRSQVVQRGLPRPQSISKSEVLTDAQIAKLPEAERPAAMIRSEMARLMLYDAADANGADTSQAFSFDVADSDMAKARAMLAAEVKQVQEEKGVTMESAMAAFEKARSEQELIGDTWVQAGSATTAQRVASYKAEHADLARCMQTQSEHATKLESKANLHTAGLVKRSAPLTMELSTLLERVDAARMEACAFEGLWVLERAAGPARVETLQSLIASEQSREVSLQARYAELSARAAAAAK